MLSAFSLKEKERREEETLINEIGGSPQKGAKVKQQSSERIPISRIPTLLLLLSPSLSHGSLVGVREKKTLVVIARAVEHEH